MGADVIKIEDPKVGDYARSIGREGSTSSAFFQCANRNKRGLRLDLSLDQGREVFFDLTRNAHVVVESFRPGVVQRLGVGYDTLREINQRLVYCSISGYGQTGPLQDKAGHDINYCAVAGVLAQNGLAEGPPAIPNFQIADLAGGALTAAMGILAALLDAERSGAGRYLDVSMTDATLAHSLANLAHWNEHGESAPRGRGTLSGGLAAYGVYATADGRYVALGALEPKFWKGFCEAVGRADLVERYQMGQEDEALSQEVTSIFAAHPLAHWQALLQDHDICLSPVNTLADAAADPLFQAREMFVTVAGSEGDPVTQCALPIKFREFDFSVERPAPAAGEHGAEILRELGYDEERISRLQKEGVV